MNQTEKNTDVEERILGSNKINSLIKAFSKRNMHGYYAEDSNAANDLVFSLINQLSNSDTFNWCRRFFNSPSNWCI